MTDRESFAAYLAENEDDDVARRAFADWLLDHDEPEESARILAWPAAKAYLLSLAEDIGYDEDDRAEMFKLRRVVSEEAAHRPELNHRAAVTLLRLVLDNRAAEVEVARSRSKPFAAKTESGALVLRLGANPYGRQR